MNEKRTIIKLNNIYKTYKLGGTTVHANADVNLEIHEGEFVVIMGASGSGKSTLMNIIGCLDRPTSGTYELDGKEVSTLDDDELAKVRNQKIGFVFQKFYLLAGLNVKENVELPMVYAGASSKERLLIAEKCLTKVGLADRINHAPNEISGGQMQRVAIARSLVNKPALLLADEPTGNLDSKSGTEIMSLFQKLHSQGTTVVLITHNPEVAKYGTRFVKLKDGEIISDEKIEDSERIILFESDSKHSTTMRLFLRGGMHMTQSLKIALNALKANKMRSLLTMLGIIIGVAAVIVMTSIGEGTRQSVLDQIYSMGSNLIYMSPGESDSVIESIGSEAKMLTMKDVNAIENKCELITAVAPQISRQVTARYLGNNLQLTVIGTTADFLQIRNFSIDKGRMFTERENKTRETVCVIGSTVAEKLFSNGDDPLGKTIKISIKSGDSGTTRTAVRLTIIGILKKKGETFGQDNDKQILTAIETYKSRLFNDKYLQVIYMEASSAKTIEQAKDEVKWAVLPFHNNKAKNIEIKTQDEILKQVEGTLAAFSFMLGGIAFISLLVGGIGIMNIMLVSVTERTREIGLRKAIGARKNDILFQFLVESLVLAITGGIIGIGIGIGLSQVYTMITAGGALSTLSKTYVSIDSILLSFSFAAMVGVFFGLYPARQAASLDPIDALRYE